MAFNGRSSKRQYASGPKKPRKNQGFGEKQARISEPLAMVRQWRLMVGVALAALARPRPCSLLRLPGTRFDNPSRGGHRNRPRSQELFPPFPAPEWRNPRLAGLKGQRSEFNAFFRIRIERNALRIRLTQESLLTAALLLYLLRLRCISADVKTPRLGFSGSRDFQRRTPNPPTDLLAVSLRF